MADKKVEMSLLVTNKSGILSSVMKHGISHGLRYQKHQVEKIDENQSRISIEFEGRLNTEQEDFIKETKALAQITNVENIKIIDSEVANLSESLNSGTQFTILRAHYVITPEAIKIAEDYLTDILGSAAPILVEAAAEKTKHIGDMYLLLSKELRGEHRSKFLALVSNLNID